MARRLALIAHDNKKVDFIAWATFNSALVPHTGTLRDAKAAA
jgi:methylglyoxal synthase